MIVDEYPELIPATYLSEQDTNESYIHNLAVLMPTLEIEAWMIYNLSLGYFKSWRWN